MEDWQFVMPDLHPGYIDWERFKANQERFSDNGRAYGIQHDQDRRGRSLACSKAASYAAFVVSEWAFATVRKTVKRS